MNGKSYQIEYGPSAIHDLDGLPVHERAQILRKIGRLQHGLHGNIKRLQQAQAMYRLRGCGWATIGSCSIWSEALY